MPSAFDATAATFDRYRSLPAGVPEAIRAAIWDTLRPFNLSRVLEIGAGTGRIGKAFVTAGDHYVGIDISLAMLQQFACNCAGCFLAQADGRQLPFRDGAFDMVLLMQVLGGVGDWLSIVSESRRVLRTGGSVIVGHTISPEQGVDAQLKRRLAAILEEMGVSCHRPQKARRQALAWLESSAARNVCTQAALWNVITTPQEFLARHRTGARFAALPRIAQEQALMQLMSFAIATFGSLDAGFQEERSFHLDMFEFP